MLRYLKLRQALERLMEYPHRPRKKDETSILSVVNFLLWLVILFCANYLYIGFLFR